MNVLLGSVVTLSPLTARLDGTSTAVPVKRLASYTPAVGDRVALLVVGVQVLTLGKIV